ncbi:uncharacterized protein LOC132196811 [Neocloeon triangulifer]|uniref:uncharacterized protein LOC132196811 n=1 Tax=Neocloeon triangulifer TaxID=2078957 RepID=UPI00286F58F1|nr:uncharacterized protein LOC132196811 [Neocloeon triangulifer]XP_059475692.1 uncharacterized protein LOC132196811 [Neocloeon triangulifer]
MANLGFFQDGKSAENVFVFVAHYMFKDDEVNERLGNDEDVANLRATFETKRGCHFREWPSPRKDELLHLLSDQETLLKYFNSNDAPSVFIPFFLSHGNRDGVIYTDHLDQDKNDYEYFTTKEVVEALQSSTALEPSLKIIFFAPCRGEIDDLVHAPGQGRDYPELRNNKNSCRVTSFPNQENFVLVYSTVETTKAVRSEKLGSVLVRYTCETLNNLRKNAPLEVLLNKIQYNVHSSIDIMGQSPEVKFFPMKKFTFYKTDVAVSTVVNTSDGRANASKITIGEDRSHFFLWLSDKHAEPIRLRWAAIFCDAQNSHVRNVKKALRDNLDFETLVLQNSAENLKWIYEKTFGEQSEVGCIIFCFFVKLLQDENEEICLNIDGKQIQLGKIIHHFIGPDNEKWIGRPKIFFFINQSVSTDEINSGEKFQLRATNHSGWFIVILPNEESSTELVEILQSPKLKMGVSLQELTMKLLLGKYGNSDLKPQIASTMPFLVDFPAWSTIFIKPNLHLTMRSYDAILHKRKNNFWENYKPTLKIFEEKTDENFKRDFSDHKILKVTKKDVTFDEFMKKLTSETEYSVFIISSLPGSGKTTMLREIACLARHGEGENIVAMISLLDQIEFFEETRRVDVKGFLAYATKTEWTEKITQEILDKRQVSIFLDGFDEICPDYRSKALALIKELARLKLPLWITTRPQEEAAILAALEDQLTTKVEIKQLEKLDQVNLLKRLLKKSDDECLQILDSFASNGASDILKNPFHLTLISECVLPSSKVSLFSIFRDVVDKKVRQALVRKESYDETSKMFGTKVKRRLRLLEKVSSVFIETLKLPKLSVDEIIEVNNTGLATIQANKSVRFVHQTFAEFLAANHFLNDLEENEDFDAPIFMHESFRQCRTFVNHYLAESASETQHNFTSFISKQMSSATLELIISEKLTCVYDLTRPLFTFDESLQNEKHFINESFAALQAACRTSESIGLELLKMGALNCLQPNQQTEEIVGLVEDIAKNNFLHLLDDLRERYPNLDKVIHQNENVNAANFAAEHGHLEMLSKLVEIGAGINLKDRFYRNALHLAIENGDLACIKILVENGANMELRDSSGRSTLLAAAASNNLEIVKYLLEYGADPRAIDENKFNALHLAVQSKNLAMAEEILLVDPSLIEGKTDYERSALHLAARAGDVELCKWLVEKGVDVLGIDLDLNNALHLACKGGHYEVSGYLLGLRCYDLSAINFSGKSALHSAARWGHWKVAQLLLENGDDIKATYVVGLNPLHYAVIGGNLETVRFFHERDPSLVKQKTEVNVLHLAAYNDHPEVLPYLLENTETTLEDVNEKSTQGLTLLMCAAHKGHEQVVRFLWRHGADLGLTDERGRNALHFAVQSGNSVETVRFLLSVDRSLVEARDNFNNWVFNLLRPSVDFEEMRFLFEAGKDVLTCVDNAGWNVLHQTCSEGTAKNVRFLLDLGCFDINTRTVEGRTLLHLAARNDVEVCQVLVEKGVDPKAVDDSNQTVLHYACEIDNLDIVEYFMGLGCFQINEDRNTDGQTVLHFSAEKNHLAVVKYLIDKGADVDLQDKRGSTALLLAVKEASVEMCRLLVANGANLNAVMDSGVDALMNASRGKNTEIVKYLLSTGQFDVRKTNDHGTTALHFAVHLRKGLDTVKLLVGNGADVNACDWRDETPITLALEYKNTEVLNFLLQECETNRT